jgi:hypothetical protein
MLEAGRLVIPRAPPLDQRPQEKPSMIQLDHALALPCL